MAPRMVALMLVGLAVAAVAPVGAEDLGEGAGFHGSEKEALDLMHKAQKIWEKGERPDGSESVGKMETALDHTIDKSMSGGAEGRAPNRGNRHQGGRAAPGAVCHR